MCPTPQNQRALFVCCGCDFCLVQTCDALTGGPSPARIVVSSVAEIGLSYCVLWGGGGGPLFSKFVGRRRSLVEKLPLRHARPLVAGSEMQHALSVFRCSVRAACT